jgi:phosphonate transport system substrate-binding protein
MMNTSGYLVLQRNHPGIAIPFLNLDMGNAVETKYGGCIIANRDANIKSLQNIKDSNLTMALVAGSSTSGNLVPRLLLNQSGIADPEKNLNVYYAGTHKKVVEDVLNGKAELGGCGCAEVEEATNKKLFKNNAVLLADFNNIPLGPMVYRKGTDERTISKIKAELVRVHELSPQVFSGFCEGWSEFKQATRFKNVVDSEYDPFRKMFGDNQLLWTLIE